MRAPYHAIETRCDHCGDGVSLDPTELRLARRLDEAVMHEECEALPCCDLASCNERLPYEPSERAGWLLDGDPEDPDAVLCPEHRGVAAMDVASTCYGPAPEWREAVEGGR